MPPSRRRKDATHRLCDDDGGSFKEDAQVRALYTWRRARQLSIECRFSLSSLGAQFLPDEAPRISAVEFSSSHFYFRIKRVVAGRDRRENREERILVYAFVPEG